MLKSIKTTIFAVAFTVFGAASASAASCDLLGSLKSVDSGIPISIEVTNLTESYRKVLWLDYQGNVVYYYGLNSGQSYTQKTFVGHPWMFTNDIGDCMQITVPKKDKAQIDIKN